MLQKFKNAALVVAVWFMTIRLALAEKIAEKTAEEVQDKVVQVVNNVLPPLGALLIFLTIVICAVKIITTANKPEERAKAMGSLPYIIGGGILLGGAMLATGLIIGQWQKLN